jgi:hypothetical protein
MTTERREHLRSYILACLRDSVLSWSDLKSLAAPGKVLKVLSQDVRTVIEELARTGAGNIARVVGELVGDVIAKKSR